MEFKCSICGKLVARPDECVQDGGEAGQYFPFCSERCKLIDLGGWFDGEYRIGPDEGDNGENEADS